MTDDITLTEVKQRFPRYSRSMGLWGKDAMSFLIAEVDRLHVDLDRAQADADPALVSAALDYYSSEVNGDINPYKTRPEIREAFTQAVFRHQERNGLTGVAQADPDA